MSLRSRSHSESTKSTGMGPVVALRPHDHDSTVRLIAEGDIPSDGATYDYVVYLFVCEEHKRLAISNRERTRVVWLPFVAIPKGVTWEQASEDGVASIIGKHVVERFDGRNDPPDPQNEASNTLPRIKMNLINVLRLQLTSGVFEVRLAQLVRITPAPGFSCCQKTTILEWVDFKDVIEDKVSPLWGPEVKQFLEKAIKPVTPRTHKYIFEFGPDDATAFLTRSDKPYKDKEKFVNSCNMNTEKVLALYEEYIEYCFPAFYMTNESFRLYLIKYGFSKDTKFSSLFKAVTYKGKLYLDFYEYLIAVLCLDQNTDNHSEERLKMLSRYYDQDSDNELSQSEFMDLVKDLHPGVSNDIIVKIALQLRQKCQFKNDKIPVKELRNAIKKNLISGIEKLCRAGKSIVGRVVDEQLQRQRELLARDKAATSTKRRDRGTCNGCRAQNIDYAMHCVTIDTMARCINPARTVNKMDVKIDSYESVMPEDRYSAEYRFGSGSVSNVFLELIRKKTNVSKEDLNGVKSLCECILDFFTVEDRLMKINAPAVVIGDILGNLAPVDAFYKFLCPSVPLIQSNMVFLGNYIGQGSNNIEVICFVFSLKLQAPNKVILLRGFNENAKEAKKLLLPECHAKYGPENGQLVCDLIVEAFCAMPFGVVIEESVICMHSGFPKCSSNRTNIFDSIPKVIRNVEDCLPAYEIISKQPIESDEAATPLQFTRKQLESFLAGCDFSHIIRGHQIPPEDYDFNFDQQCVTVSSNTITPMVVYLDPGKMLHCKDGPDVPATIRLVQLDPIETADN